LTGAPEIDLPFSVPLHAPEVWVLTYSACCSFVAGGENLTFPCSEQEPSNLLTLSPAPAGAATTLTAATVSPAAIQRLRLRSILTAFLPSVSA
jgi:hypothetical protein